MSTILDALRKVEEERRASSHSTRERLLFFPQVIPLPPPSRKGMWVIGLVLVGVGFAGGVGIMLLRSEPTASIPAAQLSEASQRGIARSVRRSGGTAVGERSLPSKQFNPPTAVAAASRLPERSPFLSTPVSQPHSGGLHNSSIEGSPLPTAMQRPPSAAAKKPYASKRSSERSSERSPQSGQHYQQPRDTLRPQVLSPPSPSGTPQVSLNLLQWSPEAERRLAFISVNGGPMLMVQEGDAVSDLRVERILPDAVELRFGNSTFVVKPRSSPSSPASLAP